MRLGISVRLAGDFGEGLSHRLVVAPGILGGAEAHGSFVAFAGDQYQILRLGLTDSELDGLSPIDDDPILGAFFSTCLTTPCGDLGADRLQALGAGIPTRFRAATRCTG